jgi:hypothetical protein
MLPPPLIYIFYIFNYVIHSAVYFNLPHFLTPPPNNFLFLKYLKVYLFFPEYFSCIFFVFFVTDVDSGLFPTLGLYLRDFLWGYVRFLISKVLNKDQDPRWSTMDPVRDRSIGGTLIPKVLNKDPDPRWSTMDPARDGCRWGTLFPKGKTRIRIRDKARWILSEIDPDAEN